MSSQMRSPASIRCARTQSGSFRGPRWARVHLRLQMKRTTRCSARSSRGPGCDRFPRHGRSESSSCAAYWNDLLPAGHTRNQRSMNCSAKPTKTSPHFVVSLLTTGSWSVIAASIGSQPSFPRAAQPSTKKSAMSKPGSRNSSPPQPHEPSPAVTVLLPERHPGSTDELLDPLYRFDPVYLNAAADVDAKRIHLSNRGADVVW